jgi:uncharacterized membrane protein YphA (DoxX/SURF4 family)
MLPRAIALIRILIGVFFLTLGIIQLMDPAFLYGGLLLRASEYGQPYVFYRRYLLGRYVEPQQEFFAYLVAGGETLLGASFLTGALVSWGALGGAFLVLNFGMAVSAGQPLLMALHLALALVFLALGRFGAGLTWGVDGWLAQRINEVYVLFPLRLSLPKYFKLENSEE